LKFWGTPLNAYGKSSILQNVGRYRFGVDTLVADCNMQRVGRVRDTGELLYNMALALYDAQTHTDWPEPELSDFEAHPCAAFNHFVRELARRREGRRFILAIDEFELIERLIEEGRVEEALLDYLRGLIQTSNPGDKETLLQLVQGVPRRDFC
jgi:hypothetical protein